MADQSDKEDKRASWQNLPFAAVFERIWHFFGGSLLLGLTAAIASLIFFFWLADEVLEGSTKVFDESVRAAVHQFASPLLTGVMIFLSFVGSFPFLTGLGVIIATVFLWLGWKRGLALFLITMAGEILLSLSLKEFYHRARPVPFFDYPLPHDYSFPSGHSSGSFCYFGIIAWLITARLESTPLKIAIWTAAAFLTLFIGLSRVYLGVHYPSDVIAGFTFAFVWVFTVGVVDHWLKKRVV